MMTAIFLLLNTYLLLLVFLQREEIKMRDRATKKSHESVEKTHQPKSILGESKRQFPTIDDKKRQPEKASPKSNKFAENTTDTKEELGEFFPMDDDQEVSEEEREEINEMFAEKEISQEDISTTRKEIQQMNLHLKQPMPQTEQEAFQTYRKVETAQFMETLVASYSEKSKAKMQEWNAKILEMEQQKSNAVPPQTPKTTNDDFDINKYLNP